jgi:MtN3 and saliva related transmembrane protein
MSISPTDAIGWAASAVLIATLLHQVRVQWRERSTEGVSCWLFLGPMSASVGFLGYSGLIGNPIFVVSNGVLVLTALVGQAVYRRNRRIEESAAAGSHREASA